MDNGKSFFVRLDESMSAFQRYSAVFLYLSTLGLVMLTVVTRNLLSFAYPWAEELAKYLMIWVASMGAALATRKNEHVCVDLIFRFIPKKLLIYYKGFLGLVSTVFIGIFANYTIRHAISIAKTRQTATSMLWFKMYWVYTILGICFLLMTFEFCRWTIGIIRYQPETDTRKLERE